MESGGVLRSRYGLITQNSFRAWTRQLEIRKTSLIKWLMNSPRKTLRGKLPVRYQVLTLRFAVNPEILAFEQIFGLKIDDRYV